MSTKTTVRVCAARALVFALLIGVATPAISQQTAEPSAPPPASGVADRYLEIREGGQKELTNRLQVAGRGANMSAIRALVSANLRRRQYTMAISGASPERLQAADVEDVAQFLAVHGYTAKDLAPGNPRALQLVQAATRAVLGGSSLRDMVFLSPVVVIGEIVSRTSDSQTDNAYRSTANVRVTEAIKGDVQAGSTIAFRQQSGPANDGLYLQLSSEIPRDASGKYLLFLSDAAYQIRGRAGRNETSATRLYSTAGTPHQVIGDSLRPIGDTDSEGGTLSEVRSFAN